MVQSVELLLDDDGDAAVRADWQALEDAGVRSQGHRRNASNRPHLTLAVAERVPDTVELALRGLAPPFPLPLVLGGLVVFGSRRLVLARSLAPSADLLAVQRAAAAAFAEIGPLPDTLRPDRWTPHVTLARGLDPESLARAVAALHDRRVDTAAVGLRRWDGRSHREWLIAGSNP